MAEGLGRERALGAGAPFSTLPPFLARPGPTRPESAFSLPRSLPWLSRAAPALQLPFHNPRWALRPACLVGWGRPSPE